MLGDMEIHNRNREVGTQGGKGKSRRRRNSLFDLKMEVRSELMPLLPDGGNVYMAYAGACALAAAYTGRRVYAAEIEAGMFAEGVPANVAGWLHADCDLEFPWASLTVRWLAADFDHYHLPYPALRPFVEDARLADRVALFFTDTAQRRLFYHPRVLKYPDGSFEPGLSPEHLRYAWDNYVPSFMLPNLMKHLLPGYTVVKWEERRRRNTIIWGVVVQARQMV